MNLKYMRIDNVLGSTIFRKESIEYAYRPKYYVVMQLLKTATLYSL